MYSKAESEIIVWLEQGYNNKGIADKFGITDKTVKFHLTNIYKKAGVKSRAEFMAKQYDNQNLRETLMPKEMEIINPQDKRNTGQIAKTQEDKIEFIDTKFKVGNTIGHLHKMMTEVTKEEINPNTVNAACNCVARLNETINTAIQAARFLNDR